MKTITAYRCDHCSRVMVTPRAMKAHEPKCFRNPSERACATCRHDFGGAGGICAAGHRPGSVPLVRLCPGWSPAEGYDEQGGA